MLRVVFLLTYLHLSVFSASIEAIELKNKWNDKKIEKIERIIKQEYKEFKSGLISMSDLVYWNTRLFQARKDKINIAYEFKVKDYPEDIKDINFEDNINYVSAMLNISIKRVVFFEKLLPFVKNTLEVGQISKRDLKIFELDCIEAYSQYDYFLKLYKDHTKTRIPYQLPSNIVKILKDF